MIALILLENFRHMALNVCELGTSGNTETTHQARVGWRRLQSSLKFFKPLLTDLPPAPLAALKPLVQATDQLRNLDVAIDTTLPAWRAALSAHPSAQSPDWAGMHAALQASRSQTLHAVKAKAQHPETATMLLKMALWIAQLATDPSEGQRKTMTRKKFIAWALKRLQRWHKRLKVRADSEDIAHPITDTITDPIAQQHRLRILAKQQRYTLENLRPWLPRPPLAHYHQRAKKWHVQMGGLRDQHMALALIADLGLYPDMVDIIRGELLPPCAHPAWQPSPNPA
jgi:CHAD domain-containing protein